MSGLNIRVGADPEVFIRRKSNKQLVSAHDLLPGTKQNPFAVAYGAIQVDGVAGEFNIDPASDPRQFDFYCQNVLSQMQEKIGVDFEISLQPVAIFDQEIWDTIPEDSKVLGCTPDFDAWTGQVNPRPNGGNTTMRTAAGHVHMSWGPEADPEDPHHQADCCLVGRQMDYYLGMVSIMWDDDTQRRSMYGKAGAIRFKPYGVEYRTMSNAWLRNEELTKFVFNGVYSGISAIINDGFQADELMGNMAQFCINNSIKWWTPEGVQSIKDAGYWPKSGDVKEDHFLSSYFADKEMQTPPFAMKLMNKPVN